MTILSCKKLAGVSFNKCPLKAPCLKSKKKSSHTPHKSNLLKACFSKISRRIKS